jgi:hypothetical protein
MVQRPLAREYLSPNLKHGAEASCKRILESNPKVPRMVKRPRAREYLSTNLKYGVEASCKRILEYKPKVW